MLNSSSSSYLFDDTQDADIRCNDDNERDDQPKSEHVQDVRAIVVHFRLPIHRAAEIWIYLKKKKLVGFMKIS